MTKNKLNLNILILIIILAVISILTIYSASTYIPKTNGNLALKQGLWYIIGFILVIILMKYKNKYLYEHAWIFYIIGNILLLGLLFFGSPINNSKCWYIIPGIGSFQPSEFMKIFLMLILSKMIHNFRSDYKNPTLKDEFIFIIKTLIILLIPSILTFMEPDTGAVMIYLIIYFCMMFSSGIRLRWFITAIITIITIITTILGIYFLNQKMFINLFGTNLFYRLDRLFSWSNGSGLQLENALSAIGSAGLLGHGFNKTPIYFPESGTDFIFAVYASNFGYIGVIFLISIIVYLDFNIIKLSKRKILDTDKYIIAGIIGMLLFQQIQNISMTIGLLPITGITLPFISYGGSSLLSYMIMVAILLNISTEKANNYKYK